MGGGGGPRGAGDTGARACVHVHVCVCVRACVRACTCVYVVCVRRMRARFGMYPAKYLLTGVCRITTAPAVCHIGAAAYFRPGIFFHETVKEGRRGECQESG